MDGVSRLLSVVGILIAAGGSAFLYQENRSLQQQVKGLTGDGATRSTERDTGIPNNKLGLEDQGAEGTGGADTPNNNPEDASAFNDRWNAQLVSALEEFKQRAQDRIETFDRVTSLRESELQDKISEVAVDESRITELVEQKYEALERAAARPRLQLARTLMKPTDGREANLITIRNQGWDDGTIMSITLHPTSFYVRKTSLWVQSESQEYTVLRLDETHNTATEPETHHDYVRQLDGEVVVPGKGSLRLLIEIENPRHLDHGLEGDLELLYNDGQSLTIPGVRAQFVAGESDSV